MKPLLCSLSLALLSVFALPAVPAQAQSGVLLRTLNVRAGRLLYDPARSQIYATLPADNSIAVVNTTTNTVTTTFFIGSNPVDLAMSPDGTRLYVLNGGSTAAGIGVVNLNTLTTLPSLPTPFIGSAIAAGRGGRLYVLGAGNSGGGTTGIAQIDATSGVYQGMLPGGVANYTGFLKISPDFNTLFYGNAGLSPSTVASFDVSTATATFNQASGFNSTGSNGQGLAVSHNGQFLVFPNGSGNGGNYTTSLIPTANLNGILGSFATGAYPGEAAFSLDDSKLYQVQIFGGSNSSNLLKVFSTRTFTQLDSFDLPDPSGGSGYTPDVTGLVLTEPNGYLYVAGTDGTFNNGPGKLMVVSTRNAPFFDNAVPLSNGFAYLVFPNGSLFGYYNFNFSPYLYHDDLGFLFPIDAADGSGGIYFYDFTSQTFLYTSSTLFPYLYDFSQNSFLYYYPDPQRPDHYTSNPRFFFNFNTGQIIRK